MNILNCQEYNLVVGVTVDLVQGLKGLPLFVMQVRLLCLKGRDFPHVPNCPNSQMLNQTKVTKLRQVIPSMSLVEFQFNGENKSGKNRKGFLV